MLNELTRVGVYGTLKQGHGNHRLLEECSKVCSGLVYGHRLYQSGIPFLIRDESSDYGVEVEVYDVDDEVLRRLDGLEGHPSCYCRIPMEVVKENGTSTEAWVYEYPSPVGQENTTGVY